MEAKLDRRQQRTRRMLRDALISLIVERGYDDLTIGDITDRADLRRATFYLHYTDKDELLNTILGETFAELVARVEPISEGDVLAGKTQVEPFRLTFQHVADNRDLYRVILSGHGGAAVARQVRAYIASLVLKGLQTVPAESLELPADVLANYVAGAELALIDWWLDNDLPYTADDMARMAHRLILDGVRNAVPT